MNFLIWAMAVGSAFGIISSFIINTSNVPSAIWFKLVPFLSGAAGIAVALKYFGVM